MDSGIPYRRFQCPTNVFAINLTCGTPCPNPNQFRDDRENNLAFVIVVVVVNFWKDMLCGKSFDPEENFWILLSH